MRPFLLLATALAALLPASAAAQDAPPDERAPLTVAVATPEGEPIPGAAVLVGTRGAATGADGLAVVEDLAPGRYRVRVSFLGRQTQEVAARLEAPGPWALVVELAEAPLELGGVVVEARTLERSRLAADGFFERQAFGLGTVLNAEALARRNPIVVGDALQGVVGVNVRRNAGNGRAAIATRAGASCRMSVYLDGTYSPFLTENVDALSAQDVVAIEVYRGPSEVPQRYNRLGLGEGCGVVLVWTERSLSERP